MMNTNKIAIDNAGRNFILTDDEVKFINTIKRLEKMKPGRLRLFGNGSLSIRINDIWADNEIMLTSIYCEGGDGGDKAP